MARKVTSKRIKGDSYGVIQRGASFTIPVEMKDEYDKPLDLTGYTVEFTVKKVKTDFDRHDDFAYIAKSFLPQDPVNGRFYVMLSSDDTDFEPGEFYFDVELINNENGMVFRLFTLSFTLDGGPTNRRVNKGMGQWPTGETITVITLAEGDPVVVIAPTINLDGDVFGQLATLMEAVDNCVRHVEECEEMDVQLREEFELLKKMVEEDADEHSDLQDQIEEIMEHLQAHDNMWENQAKINEDLLQTMRSHGLAIFNLETQVGGFDTRIQQLEKEVAELRLKHGRV